MVADGLNAVVPRSFAKTRLSGSGVPGLRLISFASATRPRSRVSAARDIRPWRVRRFGTLYWHWTAEPIRRSACSIVSASDASSSTMRFWRSNSSRRPTFDPEPGSAFVKFTEFANVLAADTACLPSDQRK